MGMNMKKIVIAAVGFGAVAGLGYITVKKVISYSKQLTKPANPAPNTPEETADSDLLGINTEQVLEKLNSGETLRDFCGYWNGTHTPMEALPSAIRGYVISGENEDPDAAIRDMQLAVLNAWLNDDRTKHILGAWILTQSSMSMEMAPAGFEQTFMEVATSVLPSDVMGIIESMLNGK